MADVAAGRGNCSAILFRSSSGLTFCSFYTALYNAFSALLSASFCFFGITWLTQRGSIPRAARRFPAVTVVYFRL